MRQIRGKGKHRLASLQTFTKTLCIFEISCAFSLIFAENSINQHLSNLFIIFNKKKFKIF